MNRLTMLNLMERIGLVESSKMVFKHLEWLFVEDLLKELQSGHLICVYFWSPVSNFAVILCTKRKWPPTRVSAGKNIKESCEYNSISRYLQHLRHLVSADYHLHDFIMHFHEECFFTRRLLPLAYHS